MSWHSSLLHPAFTNSQTYLGSKSTWETALSEIKVVVSTHQVLLDALGHGFIHISTLSLIIFDEGKSHLVTCYVLSC